MKLTNNTVNTKTQIIHIFTEKSWSEQPETHKLFDTFFSGKKEDFFVNISEGIPHFFIGLGTNPSEYDFQNIGRKFSRKYQDNFTDSYFKIDNYLFSEKELSNFVLGLILGTYSIKKQDSESKKTWIENCEICIENFSQEHLQNIQNQSENLANAQFFCQDWLNKGANQKTVSIFSSAIEKLAEELGIKHTVYNKQKCEEIGLGAFLSVNQGSSQDAAFTILEYKSDQTNAKTVGLIGKSVLFDTGGISLKNSDNMHYMKSDMGGATAVLGALIYAVKMKLPVNIVAVLPVTDNAISQKAYLPSDVIKAYNGKTIEVLNTDAEGRMTLADALSFVARNFETDVMIDLATLTGSSVRMFGDTCGALFSNNIHLQNQLINSGEITKERLWNMPLWDIWKNDFKSDVADYKNISMKPIGDCIVAAKFLEQFIEEHPNWAHLDIAGVAFGNVDYAKEKAATGYGVQLLTNFLENFN